MSYLRALRRAGERLRPGRVFLVEIAHDPTCPRLRGEECECDAEVRPPVPLPRSTDPRS